MFVILLDSEGNVTDPLELVFLEAARMRRITPLCCVSSKSSASR